jgi:hypothetical protein
MSEDNAPTRLRSDGNVSLGSERSQAEQSDMAGSFGDDHECNLSRIFRRNSFRTA